MTVTCWEANMHKIRRIGGLHIFLKNEFMQSIWNQRWQQFSFFAVSCLAVASTMGAALISLSKVLLLIAVFAQVYFDLKNKSWPDWREWPLTCWAVLLAFAWISLSWFWIDSTAQDAWKGWGRYSRLLWLVAVVYVLRTPLMAQKILKWQVGGLVFLLISSWMLWLGLPVPWATAAYPPELGIVSASTLEQPVYLTILVAYLWVFKSYWTKGPWRFIVPVLIAITIINIFFIMTGRTGFLVMFVLSLMALYWALPQRWKYTFWVIPLVSMVVLFNVSPRFQNRTAQVLSDIQNYQQGNAQTSQGMRLDYWHRSLLAISEKPILGHGVGSWRSNYHRLGGIEQELAPSNPHQQYLLWAVEGGLVGLLFLLGIFAALYKDALTTEPESKRFMLVAVTIAAVMSFMNCPFFGVGLGEFFVVIYGCLLVTRSPQHTNFNNQ